MQTMWTMTPQEHSLALSFLQHWDLPTAMAECGMVVDYQATRRVWESVRFRQALRKVAESQYATALQGQVFGIVPDVAVKAAREILKRVKQLWDDDPAASVAKKAEQVQDDTHW
jgi:hypothetical protein